MEQSFFERLEERAQAVGSLLCVGLDPHPADVGRDDARAARDFCLRLIEATGTQVLAFKPNAAFFEAYGIEGWQALAEVIQAVPEGIQVVLDAKRGDIASSAEAYAQAVFSKLGADAVTVSPYMGGDSLIPFLEQKSRGAFLLCKTSNPGSADLQDRILADGSHFYEYVARLACEWNTKGNLGLVVGATFPDALQRVRRIAPDLWFLSPGIGFQGGDLQSALQAGLRSDGLGLLLPVSRGISQSGDPAKAAHEFNKTIRDHVRTVSYPGVNLRDGILPVRLADLAQGLLDCGCVKFGQFTLKSGLVSPIYLDLRVLASVPTLLSQAASAYQSLVNGLVCDRLAGLPYAALPIATALSLQTGIPLIYPRKEAKDYGTKAEIEGIYRPGENAVIIDDLATTGGSKFEAIEKLKRAGLNVKDIVVLIDRQSGAGEALTEAGYRLHSVFTLRQLLDEWEYRGAVPPDQIAMTRKFLEDPCTQP